MMERSFSVKASEVLARSSGSVVFVLQYVRGQTAQAKYKDWIESHDSFDRVLLQCTNCCPHLGTVSLSYCKAQRKEKWGSDEKQFRRYDEQARRTMVRAEIKPSHRVSKQRRLHDLLFVISSPFGFLPPTSYSCARNGFSFQNFLSYIASLFYSHSAFSTSQI